MEQIPIRRRVVFSDYFSPLGQMAISGRIFIPECRGVTEVPKDEKYILVTKDASPTNLIYLGNAMAVVSEVGGILIHLAIACRELDIPFIRIDEATKALKDGEFVELVMKPKIKEKGAARGMDQSISDIRGFRVNLAGGRDREAL